MFRAALLLALGGAAVAQDQVYLDAELDVGEDRPLQGHGRGALSIAPTGNVVAVALERSILITDRLGRTKARITNPGRALEFVCVVAVDDNEVAVLYRHTGKSGLSLFRHGADGRLKRERRITDMTIDLHTCAATKDNALLLLGSPDRYAWWLGKFSLDGVRVFEARSNGRHPESIAAMAARPAGRWYALIQRLEVNGASPEWYVHHYVDGRLKEELRVGLSHGGHAAVLGAGSVIAVNQDLLHFVDDLGSIRHEASWPFHRTGPILAGEDGFWAIVSHGDAVPDKLVRVNSKGEIRFRHPPRRIAGISRAPDNQIAIVVVSDDGRKARLMRFDHRSGIEHLP